MTVRDGEKGPLRIGLVTCRVLAKTEQGQHEPVDTPLEELARVVKAEHRIEDCLKRAKSQAGLSDYEVRTWPGWYHHQTQRACSVLSLQAT